jgi:anti-sigma factor RsiW
MARRSESREGNMSCERLEGKLIAFVDGHASESDRRAVEEHIRECAVCKARVKGFSGIWNVLDELPVHEPSSAFDARLRARLAAEPVRQSAWGWLMPAPRFALAVMMLAVFSIWISSRTPAPAPVATVPSQTAVNTENDFGMIKDLKVLENYDVLANFDALSQLPASQQGSGSNN